MLWRAVADALRVSLSGERGSPSAAQHIDKLSSEHCCPRCLPRASYSVRQLGPASIVFHGCVSTGSRARCTSVPRILLSVCRLLALGCADRLAAYRENVANAQLSNSLNGVTLMATLPQAKELEKKDAIGSDNIGHKLLQKMGWREGDALGGTQKGITQPIKAAPAAPAPGARAVTFCLGG